MTRERNNEVPNAAGGCRDDSDEANKTEPVVAALGFLGIEVTCGDNDAQRRGWYCGEQR